MPRLASADLKTHLLGIYFDFRFQRLALTHALDGIGNTLVAISLAGTLFFAVPSDKASGRVLLYLVFTMTPFAIVSATIAPLLDRGMAYRRMAVLAAGFGRAVLAWLMATRTDGLLLFPLALGVLVGQRLYSIARSSLVPACLPPEAPLLEANSFLSRTTAIAGFLTAVVGSILNAVGGADWVLHVAALVYLAMGIAGLLLPGARPRRILTTKAGRASAEAAAPAFEAHPETIDPSRTVLILPGVRAIAALRALSGFLLFLLAFNLRRTGGGTADFGVLLLGVGIGAFLAALIAPTLNRLVREDVLIFCAFLLAGIAPLFAARAFSLLASAVLGGVAGASFGVSKLAFDSTAQRGLPREIQGRQFARWETTFQLAWVAGALIPVAVTLAVEPALVVAGLVTISLAIFYMVDANRARRSFEEAAQAAGQPAV